MRSPLLRLVLFVCVWLCAGASALAQSGAAAQSWAPAGPAQIQTQPYGPLAGRVTSVAVDLSDATGNTVALGTSGGGVWRSTNAASANAMFAPLTDDLLVFNDGEATASIAIGAVTVQPGGTGVVLAGTGEAAPFADAHYGEGLLRSEDNGQSWTLVQESHDGAGGNHSFTGEGFAGFAWGPANTAVAAVGLPGGSAQVGAVTLGASVRGLYASQDAGQTWQLATIQDIAADGSTQIVQGPQTDYAAYDGNSALAVTWNSARQMFYAAVQYHGVYGSPDGLTWTRLAKQPGTALPLPACPTDPGYAASPACPLGQAALAVNAATGDMYAWYVDANGNDRGLWEDVCAAQNGTCANAVTFSARIATAALEQANGQIAGGTSGLSLLALPVPSGSDAELFAGAESLSTCDVAGGCAWQQSCAGNIFPGVRALAGTSAPGVFAGTQGGAWFNKNAAGCAANSFANLNGGLGPLAPLVSVAGSSADASVLLAGSGMLGSAGTASAPAWSAAGASAPQWPQLSSAEGGVVAFDGSGGAAYITVGAGVQIARCAKGSACAADDFSLAIGGAQVEQDQALLHAPFALDPSASAQMLVGTCRAWRGPATGAGWSAANVLSPMFDGNQQSSCNGNTLVRGVAAGGPNAADGSQVMYAGMQGLALNASGVLTPNAGHLFVTENAAEASGSTPWMDIALSPVMNGGVGNAAFNAEQFDVSAIAVDAHDPTGATVYVTIYGFHEPHAYRSTDFGAHWWNVSANLPDAPASAVVIDPNDANTVYVALDTGVYFTRAITQCPRQDCWQQYGAGLPNAQVAALEADGGTTGLLRAATQGRGAWQIPLATSGLAAQTTVAVAPMALAFAPQAVSTQSAPQTMTLTVTGANPLMATQVVVTGDFAETDTCTGAAVPQQANCAIQVTFAPSAAGSRSGTVTIYGNLPAGQAGPFALSGTGLSPPAVMLSPSGTLNFGDVTLGSTSATQFVELENTGQAAATLNGFAVTGAFAIAGNACGASLPAQQGCVVALAFTPTARGQQTGILTVTDSAGMQTLNLEGTGEAAANVAFSPAALSFASTRIGATSSPQVITAANSGDVSATITGLSASGDFAVSNGCGQSVAGNSSCSLSVTFSPTQQGMRTGSVTLTTGEQTVVAQLSGTGVGTPALTLTPPSLNFGPQNLQQPSAPQTMVLTNTGNGSDTITAITTGTATAGTTDYSVSSDCMTLTPGASCTISITFAPSVAGEDDGTLTVSASAPGSSINAALYGSGNALAWTAGQSPSATVPAGQTASYALQLQVVGYQGLVSMSCSGLPAGASCSWGQMTPTNVSTGLNSVMVTVATGPDVAASGRSRWLALALCCPLLALPFARRRRWMVALLACAALLCGCGAGAQHAPAGTLQAGTYTFTVTASGGGLSSSLPCVLVVD